MVKRCFNVNSISENGSSGYILEVDLTYPKQLYELHNDYLLAPEKFAIPYEMLSHYYKRIVDEHRIKVGDVKKLISNLGDKTNYIVHYGSLQLYLSLGMKLNKIHRALKFKQTDSMKTYIDFNTEKRKNVTNSFEKDFFKLRINSVYGKTMENLRKIITVKIVNNDKDYLKHTTKPTFVSPGIFDKNYAAIHEIKPVLTLKKPIYVAFTILEFSK